MSFSLPAEIIGEAGTNHAAPAANVRYSRALSLIYAARACGADAVKFQMFAPSIRDDMFCWLAGDENRAERWEQTCLRFEEWRDLKGECERIGLVFLASVFQHRTVAWLKELGVKATKVASRASANFPYDQATGTLLISTGMPPYPTDKGILLECESKYPSARPWRGEYPGFSAHSPTPDLAIDAIKRGCKLVEVHFYIDPGHAGRDLPASLMLDGLRAVCAARDA